MQSVFITFFLDYYTITFLSLFFYILFFHFFRRIIVWLWNAILGFACDLNKYIRWLIFDIAYYDFVLTFFWHIWWLVMTVLDTWTQSDVAIHRAAAGCTTWSTSTSRIKKSASFLFFYIIVIWVYLYFGNKQFDNITLSSWNLWWAFFSID